MKHTFLAGQPEVQQFLFAVMTFEFDLRAESDPSGVASARNVIGCYEEWQAAQQGRKTRATDDVIAHYRAVIAQWPGWYDLVLAFYAERIQEARGTVYYANSTMRLPPSGLPPRQMAEWFHAQPSKKAQVLAFTVIQDSTTSLATCEARLAMQEWRAPRSIDELIAVHGRDSLFVRDDGAIFSLATRLEATERIMGIQAATGAAIIAKSVANLDGEDIRAAAARYFQHQQNGVLLFFAKDEKDFAMIVGNDMRQVIPPSVEEGYPPILMRDFTANDFDSILLAAIDRISLALI